VGTNWITHVSKFPLNTNQGKNITTQK